ncbi:MAG: bifunctional diaminohydroxyphosphoribosylaminopyrimidine deaminase/5-amino-6-(5-phosphoribosylamino)uracil reductase RibD [Desulfobacteraceae bacterium]|jgi:diaminohydroxyphosphoribosylaminopyrimidine deaminase/5-amino-6-(5-phosphoribosylamino)uracil reductase
MDHEKYMRTALELAAKGAGYVSPNPMVGAVMVKDGRVVGQGYHQALGGPHAEVNAIDDAGEQARGATLYVTLEPCNHYGRTPPCTQKILNTGIRRVVVAVADPNPHVTGGGNAFLKSQGIEVICGVCEEAATRLNESFIKYMRTHRPFVVLKMAATLDGRIATRTGDARWVTGAEARGFVHQLRHAMDAIMVGVGTVKADDPELTTRLDEGRGVDPARVVLDTHLSISSGARMLNQLSPAQTIIVCGPDAAEANKMRLKDKGACIMEVPVKDGRIDLQILLERLGQRGLTSVLVEGGSLVAGEALKAGVVDKVHFFYAPKILGGDDGVPMLAGQGPDKMEACMPLTDTRVNRMGDDILVTGYLK